MACLAQRPPGNGPGRFVRPDAGVKLFFSRSLLTHSLATSQTTTTPTAHKHAASVAQGSASTSRFSTQLPHLDVVMVITRTRNLPSITKDLRAYLFLRVFPLAFRQGNISAINTCCALCKALQRCNVELTAQQLTDHTGLATDAQETCTAQCLSNTTLTLTASVRVSHRIRRSQPTPTYASVSSLSPVSVHALSTCVYSLLVLSYTLPEATSCTSGV